MPAMLLALCLLAGARAEATTFPHPERIRYDGQCFTINGKDTFVFSGAFHYFRCAKPLWADRFRKIKDAGFNTVETYVAWNAEEPNAPKSVDDFSQVSLRNLRDWLHMAIDQFGLNVIVRPGPYICAEWQRGGYPAWLLRYKPKDWNSDLWLRTDEPSYLNWCRHWYKAVSKVVAPYQITHRPEGKSGVILFQIENEYDYSGKTDEVRLGQLQALAGEALKDGIDVPLLGCWTHQIRNSQDPFLSRAMDSINLYPGWDVDGTRWAFETIRKDQTKAPLMVTELQGGWFSEVGGKLAQDQPGLDPVQEQNLTLFAIQNGASSLNYYMLYGGTNFGDWTPPNITTSYDYFAPIREWGGLEDKYYRVQQIGQMLQKYGPALARSRSMPGPVATGNESVEVAIRVTDAGAGFVFVRNRDHLHPASGDVQIPSPAPISVHYDLEPFGSNVLYIPNFARTGTGGTWLIGKTMPARRASVAPRTIAEATEKADDGGRSQSIAQLKNLIDLGIFDSRYVGYEARLDWKQGDSTLLGLRDADTGRLIAAVNGQLVSPAEGFDGYQVFDLASVLKPGENKVRVLLENPGNANGGRGMEELHGLVNGQIVKKPQAHDLGPWRFHVAPRRSNNFDVAADVDDSSWPTIATGPDADPEEMHGRGTTGVFRSSFEVAQSEIDAGATVLRITSLDDQGWIYVNGQKAGQTARVDESFSTDIGGLLHPGRNVIAIVVRNQEGPGGIRGSVSLGTPSSKGLPLAWAISTELQGVRERWADPKTSDQGWQKVALGTATSSRELMTWYRLGFDLPASDSKRPHKLHLLARGNGFLYLNGRLLGRYWNAGPQHDYYLPECWVKPGHNVVALSLRPLDAPAGVDEASVGAY